MNHVIQGGFFSQNEMPLFVIWDMIPLASVTVKGRYGEPYKHRFQMLTALLQADSTHLAWSRPRSCIVLRKPRCTRSSSRKAGKEGSVIKRPDAIWRDGTSKEQVKIKLEFEVDLEVVAVVPGNVGTKNEGRAGSLRCKTSWTVCCGSMSRSRTRRCETVWMPTRRTGSAASSA